MSKTRHTILAYLLLFAVLFLLLKMLVLPTYSSWKTQALSTRALEVSLRELKAQLALVEKKNEASRSELRSFLQSGKLSPATKASDAGHRLQETIKSLFEPYSVTIAQLRPSNESRPNGLSKSILELSVRVPAQMLQPLLKSLSMSKPSLHVGLINIRSSTRQSNNSQNDLELSLNLAMWYVESPSALRSSMSKDGVVVSDEVDSANNSEQSSSEQNVLLGLFDSDTRRRFTSPDPVHYRVAAINISRSSRVAIIANTGDGKTRRLEQGDYLDVWRVESIENDRIVLAFGDRRDVISLSR